MIPYRKSLIAMSVLSLLAVPIDGARAAPVKLTPRTVVTRALKHNLGLKYERLAPELTRASERIARSGYDTTLFGSITGSGDGDGLRIGLKPGFDLRLDAAVGLRRNFTTGTRLEATLGGLLGYGGNGTDPGRVTYQGSLALSVRHPLLLGSSKAVNEAAITTARLDRDAAHQRLRRKVEEKAAEALKAYWDLHAALASHRIQEVALKQARKTFTETRILIQHQKIAASEAVEAEHQVKTQERAALLAKQAVNNHRDKLARLMGVKGKLSLTTPAYVTSVLGGLPVPKQRVKALHATALQHRGDYRAEKITRKSRQTDLGVARHSLLPALDFVGSVGVYGHNNRHAAATDPTLGLIQGRVAWSAGLVLEIPLSHQEAKARREVADLRVRQSSVTVEQKELAIAEELKVALRGLKAAEALAALAATAVTGCVDPALFPRCHATASSVS